MMVDLTLVLASLAFLASIGALGVSLAAYVKVLASEKSTHTIFPATEQPTTNEAYVPPEVEQLLQEPFEDPSNVTQEIKSKDLEEQLLRGI